MAVEIMDLESANLVASFEREDEALRFVRETMLEAGEAAVAMWALGYVDRSRPAVAGADLVKRSLEQAVA